MLYEIFYNKTRWKKRIEIFKNCFWEQEKNKNKCKSPYDTGCELPKFKDKGGNYCSLTSFYIFNENVGCFFFQYPDNAGKIFNK